MRRTPEWASTLGQGSIISWIRRTYRNIKLTLGLTGLEENVGDDLVDLTDELEERVLGEMLQGEFSLSSVSRIGLSEDGVTVTWYDLSTLQCRPNVLCDLLVGSVLTDLGSHLLDPSEDLLVSETKCQPSRIRVDCSRKGHTHGGDRRDR